MHDSIAMIEKVHTNISGQKDLVERSGKVIDTLHVATCRMPYGPYI